MQHNATQRDTRQGQARQAKARQAKAKDKTQRRAGSPKPHDYNKPTHINYLPHFSQQPPHPYLPPPTYRGNKTKERTWVQSPKAGDRTMRRGLLVPGEVALAVRREQLRTTMQLTQRRGGGARGRKRANNKSDMRLIESHPFGSPTDQIDYDLLLYHLIY